MAPRRLPQPGPQLPESRSSASAASSIGCDAPASASATAATSLASRTCYAPSAGSRSGISSKTDLLGSGSYGCTMDVMWPATCPGCGKPTGWPSTTLSFRHCQAVWGDAR